MQTTFEEQLRRARARVSCTPMAELVAAMRERSARRIATLMPAGTDAMGRARAMLAAGRAQHLAKMKLPGSPQ